MAKLNYYTFIAFMVLIVSCQSAIPVKTGLDNINDYKDLFKNKKVGIITNHTAYNSHGLHITDIFLNMENVQLTALFGPEHGIRGDADAGAEIDSGIDPLSGIPIYSLYGSTRKPNPEMLEEVDVLVFDIQDIGSRFYTYIWTMALAMEAAAEQDIPFVVLDRPNPLNGNSVEGNILETKFSTFVGLYPIPIRHGMTVGELAQMFNGEGWLKDGIQANLNIVPLKNWPRASWYDQTGLKFINPSPNMPDFKTAVIYPGLCLIEGTNVSEGRGTLEPFLQFGAPWIDKKQFSSALNALKLPGVRFQEETFTPRSIKGMSTNPKHQDKLCFGARIEVTDRSVLKAYETGVRVIELIHKLYPDSMEWRQSHFDRLCGTAKIRESIITNKNLDSLLNSIRQDEDLFRNKRQKYLLY